MLERQRRIAATRQHRACGIGLAHMGITAEQYTEVFAQGQLEQPRRIVQKRCAAVAAAGDAGLDFQLAGGGEFRRIGCAGAVRRGGRFPFRPRQWCAAGKCQRNRRETMRDRYCILITHG